MLVRLVYLAVTNAFAALRLFPMGDREKDIEILTLRHQISVLQRQVRVDRPRFEPADRALLAALLAPLPRDTLRRMRLIIQPDTVLRWQHDLLRRRHAERSKRKRPGRPRTVASVRRLVLRLVHENPAWGYRRVHGELATLGIKVAASTVWQIIKDAGLDPAPDRAATTWGAFLRSQADAILACDFLETVTLSGQRQYVLAVIEHASRRIRILGATAHPTAAWVSPAITPAAQPAPPPQTSRQAVAAEQSAACVPTAPQRHAYPLPTEARKVKDHEPAEASPTRNMRGASRTLSDDWQTPNPQSLIAWSNMKGTMIFRQVGARAARPEPAGPA